MGAIYSFYIWLIRPKVGKIDQEQGKSRRGHVSQLQLRDKQAAHCILHDAAMTIHVYKQFKEVLMLTDVTLALIS